MNVTRSLEQMRHVKNSVVTVGTFDGVHCAHREIIREVVNRAHMREGRSVAVTFDPHPKSVVASARGPVQLLSTPRERVALLRGLHLDELLIIPFSFEFSRIGAGAFLKDIVSGIIGVSEVVVGHDHTFGRDREAGTEQLIALGRDLDFSVFAVHPLTLDGEPISSTRIRKALSTGELDRAAKMLGYHYQLTGEVVNGDHRGRTMGFPTANIMPEDPHKLIPANGVYLVAVELPGELHYGMMNIGVRPTVTSGTLQVLEVHILDFDRDIYGATMTVTFLKRLREERRFTSLEELIGQLSRDREAVRQARLSVSYSPTQSKE
jgi:riboflavin kinase / FMN adenylyltransferase